jgi:ribosomal subunit interface protein
MQIPLKITFEDIGSSKAVEDAVYKEAAQIERYFERITGCHVFIASPHRHHRQGRLYSVRIDLTVPGDEIVINREHRLSHAHEDVYIALHQAFHSARRKLEDYVRRMRRQIKTHEGKPQGNVTQLFPDADYGFIKTAEGRDVYFHRNSVLGGGFDRLQIGSKVSFVEEMGEKGPSASSVRMLRPHRAGATSAELVE